ncbi:MAG: Ig-like domain-containing protein, partial [Lachnospiraceae bacterium]|nr:Ig-like domain-containing protein [Lachnospiraceae bacterium]
TEAAGVRPDGSENPVSENTAADEEDEIPDDWSGEPTLGEPFLMTEATGGYAAYSDNGISPMAEGIRRQTPDVRDIIDRYKAYPWSLDVANSYSVEPSVKDPYRAGYLSDESLENALNLLNFIRYVAGVPADVTLSGDYMEKAQAGALLNRINGKVDYKPAKPDNFPDGLYQTGYQGCVKGNLAAGYGNLAKSLLNGWVFDGASSNIDLMVHRRWILNPSMTKTGFGAVGSYAAMYAQDSSGSGITDYVAWPAQNMPIELMNGSGTPWTLSLGSDYEKANFQEVSVTLRDITNNKSWAFSGSNATGVFKVNIEYYGMPNCIIFRPPNVSYSKNSQFQVTVSGIKLKDGTDTKISYNVDFFSLEEEPAEVEEVTLNKDTLHLLKGVEGKQEESLLATVKPGNVRDKSLVWKSKDEAVATVDETGRVLAVGVGTTEISATAVNGVQGVCTVRVSDYSLQSDAVGFSYDEETKTYRLSFDLTMNAKPGRLAVMDGDPAGTGGVATDTVRWISENENVAAADTHGNITPLAVGETLVWADVDDGLAVLECTVKVEDSKLPQIELRENACTLTIKKDAAGNLLRESRQLRLYFSPTDSKWVNRGQNYVKWTSSDPTAAAFVVEQPDGTQDAEPAEDGGNTGSGNTISGNTVTVTAVGTGVTEVSAVIVDEEGNPVADSDGKTAETSCTVTVQAEAELADQDIPRPVALTNTQTKLGDVALPEGWRWEAPDTVLTQFAGRKTKKFAAIYQPADAGKDVLPARRFLEVYFLTLEKVSMGMRMEDGKEGESAALTVGQGVACYVNYSFAEALEQLENNADYKNNVWFRKQKEEILKEIGEIITWSNSKPDVVSMERTADGVKFSAKSVGSSTVKAGLKLGGKTFNASVKLTVKEAAGTLTVKEVKDFTRIGETDSGTGQAEETYAALLAGFQTEKANQVNSK